MLHEFIDNFTHNLFKPLLLFFYAGFLIPLFRVKLEFPKPVYQALTIYLLIAIGWKGGKELAGLEPELYGQAAGFMLIGFCMNLVIGIAAYKILRLTTRLRQIDAATVAGYYGSDSAGTFVTCTGVLAAASIAYAPYMPVMLAVMEIPGCLVALYLVSKMRSNGLDSMGNMPGELGYNRFRQAMIAAPRHIGEKEEFDDHHQSEFSDEEEDEEELVAVGSEVRQIQAGHSAGGSSVSKSNGNGRSFRSSHGSSGSSLPESDPEKPSTASGSGMTNAAGGASSKKGGWMSRETLHEVFMNPGIFLLFAGLGIGFISRVQGAKVTDKFDPVFETLFFGLLCLFLLEMGITASKKLKDLGSVGWQFPVFALLAPNLFAASGMLVAHGYSMFLGQPFDVGTYVLFGVLCGAASYIALPAVQQLAIPEASPTLPLAASLGVTFSYNVTIGIPVYILMASTLTKIAPVVAIATTATAAM